MIVLKGRVLDGNGGAPIEKGAVVLEDDRIRLVCRQSELPDDPTAEVYELEDGTIMPGLIDAHVHMGWGSATAVDWISMTPQLSMARALRDMAQLRQQGYAAFGCPYSEATLELERLCVAGYTPMEVITMATKVNARLLQMEDQLGTLETGKLADVLLVEGRPDEDIRVLRRSDHVKLVVQDGRIVKNAMPHTAKA